MRYFLTSTKRALHKYRQKEKQFQMKYFLLRNIVHVLKYTKTSGKINFSRVLIKASQKLVYPVFSAFEPELTSCRL